MPPPCRCQLWKHKSALRWSTGGSATCFPHSYYKMALQSPYRAIRRMSKQPEESSEDSFCASASSSCSAPITVSPQAA